MSRSSGPWICIVLVALGFILASTVLPQPDPNNPTPARSPFGRGGGRGGRFSTYGNSTQQQQQQQQRSPFPMGRGAGRGMFPFFQPPPPPPRQQQPPPGGQSNIEEREVAVDKQQQQQQEQHPVSPEVQPQTQQPVPQEQQQEVGRAAEAQSSTGEDESTEEEVVKEIPAVMLAFLYGGIGSSLLILLCFRMYAWCCPPRSLYSPVLNYYPPASTSPLISPLSLYQYQPPVSSTATTASVSSHRFTPPLSSGSGTASSPLAMSLPNERSYASMSEMERGGGQLQSKERWGERGWGDIDDDKDQLVWAYSV